MYYIGVGINFLNNYDFIEVNFINIILVKLNNFYFNFFILIYTIFIWVLVKNLKFYVFALIYFIKLSSSFKYILSNFFLGYYKIHPILLYIILIILVCLFIRKKFFFKFTKIRIINTITTTLVLGSLWALTQSIWSKYWSNDSIEIILLLIVVFICFLIHSKLFFKNNYKNLMLLNVITLIISLRLNLIYTKHNFFQKTINFQIYIYLLCLLIIYNTWQNKNATMYYVSNNIFKTIVLFISLSIITNIVNFSFVKNFIYFFWSLMLLFFYLKLLKIIMVSYTVHLIYITILINFNFYFINYLNNFNFVYYNRVFENCINYFYVKKKTNFWVWKKPNSSSSLVNNYILIKNFTKISYNSSNYLQIKLINFF